MFYASSFRDFTSSIGEAECLSSQERWRDVYPVICADGDNFYEVGKEVIVEDGFTGSLGKFRGYAIHLTAQF